MLILDAAGGSTEIDLADATWVSPVFVAGSGDKPGRVARLVEIG